MRNFALLIAILLGTGITFGECLTVYGTASLDAQLSSANIRIITVLDGKPVQGARVFVYSVGPVAVPSRLMFTLVTDDKGIAIPPELAAGSYEIEVWTSQGAFAELYITVPMDGRKVPEAYSMSLRRTRAQAAIADLAAGKEVPGRVLQEFAGIVLDASGAPIPGARIDVWMVKALDQSIAATVTADAKGGFSVPLPGGLYVAIFRENGFRLQVLSFEITGGGTSQDSRTPLAIRLDVNSC